MSVATHQRTKMTEERQSVLVKELAELGLELRSDSSLCRDFIAGETAMSVEAVCTEMATMHWLHSHTSYQSDLEQCVDHLIKEKGAFKGIWRSAATIVKTYLVATRKPKSWPWLETS